MFKRQNMMGIFWRGGPVIVQVRNRPFAKALYLLAFFVAMESLIERRGKA